MTRFISGNSSQFYMSSLLPSLTKAHHRDMYKTDFLLGTALSVEVLRGEDAASLELAQRNFNAFTAENSMKPSHVQPSPGTFCWDESDRMVQLAQDCGAAAIGHTLVWHEQTPKWFFETPTGIPLEREVALANMGSHIATVVGRYKGRIQQWDVVNEAISDSPGEDLRSSPWLKAAGEEFIAEAFRAAHKADPSALLIYNDYNIELSEKREKTLRLLKRLQEQEVPIHAVGIQGHWHLDYPELSEIECAIELFASLGLRVIISELDIGVLPTKYQGANIQVQQALKPEMNPYTKGLPEEVAHQQALRYEEIFSLFSRYQSVIDRVTFWGIHDGVSWLNHFPVRGRTDYPLLFDRKCQPKPAFHAVERAMKGNPVPK